MAQTGAEWCAPGEPTGVGLLPGPALGCRLKSWRRERFPQGAPDSPRVWAPEDLPGRGASRGARREPDAPPLTPSPRARPSRTALFTAQVQRRAPGRRRLCLGAPLGARDRHTRGLRPCGGRVKRTGISRGRDVLLKFLQSLSPC